MKKTTPTPAKPKTVRKPTLAEQKALALKAEKHITAGYQAIAERYICTLIKKKGFVLVKSELMMNHLRSLERKRGGTLFHIKKTSAGWHKVSLVENTGW